MKDYLISKLLLIVISISFILVGCSGATDVASTKINKDITGERNFTQRLYLGDEETIIVYGTAGSETNTTHLKWLGEAQKNMLQRSFGITLKNINIKSDAEVTDEDIKNKHIILLGNLETNSLYKKVNEYLPIKVEGNTLVAGNKVFDEDTITYNFTVPNPLNKNKYLWVFGALNSNNLVNTIDGSPIHDYEIKINGNEKYADEFIKGEYEWNVKSNWKNAYYTENFITKESEHFIFLYPTHHTKASENIGNIIEKREEAYQRIIDKLNIRIDNKIEYYLFTDLNSWYTYRDGDSGENRWLGQICDFNDIDDEENNSFKSIILATILEMKGKPLSFFAPIGLYDIVFPEDYEKYSINRLKEVIISSDYIPLESLIAYKLYYSSDTEIGSVESIFFSRYLVDEYGIEKYMDFYKANQTKEADKAITEVYGKTIIELEEDWLAYIDEVE